MGDGGYATHFQTRMTRVRRATGEILPQCPDSFVLWTAGKDGKFGYWRWDDASNGWVLDDALVTTDDVTTLPE